MIEPHLFSAQRAVASLPFVVAVDVDSSATVADVSRTMLSLSAQSFTEWSVAFAVCVSPRDGVADLIERLQTTEPRLAASRKPSVRVTLRAGDALAPLALNEIALAVATQESYVDVVDVVVGDFDHLAAGGGQRVDPVRISVIDPDAAQQFDLLSGFAAYVGDATRKSVSARLAAGDVSGIVQIPLVLVHRRPRIGARVVELAPAEVDDVRAATPTNATVGVGGLGLGTRVQRRAPATVAVVVRNPVANPSTHRAEIARNIGAATLLGPGLQTGSCAALALAAENADVLIVVDGSLRLGSPDLIDDLVGALLRDNVFAVAPIVTVPSGMVVDAGLSRSDGRLIARCGGFFRPPFDLPWVRAVDSLSGRILANRVADLLALGDSPLDHVTLETEGSKSSRRMVVWPHQQAIVTYGLADRDAGSPAAAAWTTGRLAEWFGPDVASYRPLNDSKSESVW